MSKIRKGEIAMFVGGAIFITLASSSLYLLSVIQGELPHDVFVLGLILLTWAVYSPLYWYTNDF